jgi:hypothetical protein
MSEKLAKYIITTGEFDGETNNFKEAKKQLKRHAEKMRLKYGLGDSYGIYMLVETYKGEN